MAEVLASSKPPGEQPPAPPPYNAQQTTLGYPPQGHPQAQPLPQPQTQTVVVTTVATQGVIYRATPMVVQCPNCQNQVTSTCIYENGMMVWVVVLVLLFVLQLWLGCCLIPLCITGLKDVRHLCPVCKYQLGIYKRL